jgi:phenylalanyl-tRNA synthetase beta chain
MNSKAGYDEFALFEIGKAHRKGDVDDDGLPLEYSRIALVYAAKKQSDGAAYFQAKRLLEQLSDNLTYIPLDTASIDDEITQQMVAPFEPTRSALVMSGDIIVGVVGEYKADVARAFKLSAACAGFELQLSYFENHNSRHYRPLSRFPSVTQDISLRVTSDVPYRAVFESATSVIDALDETYDTNLAPLNIYQAKEDMEHKTITLRLRIANHEKTLTDKDVNVIMDQIAAAEHASYNAERV